MLRKYSNVNGMVNHYNDVIMGAMGFQITSLTTVYSTLFVKLELWVWATSDNWLTWISSEDMRGARSHRFALQLRHNEHDGVSNHQSHDCLFNRLLRRKSKKPSKLRVTGLCAGNSPVTGEFPTQRSSYAKNVSIWWRHHWKWEHLPISGIEFN